MARLDVGGSPLRFQKGGSVRALDGARLWVFQILKMTDYMITNASTPPGKQARKFAYFPIRSRRNLSKSQKAMAAAKMANMPNGGAQYRSANLRTDTPQVSQSEAAEMFEVSERSVQTAAMIEREAPAEVAQAVLDGAMSLNLDDLIAEANDAADWLGLAAAPDLDDLIDVEACLDDTRIACTDFERSDAGA